MLFGVAVPLTVGEIASAIKLPRKNNTITYFLPLPIIYPLGAYLPQHSQKNAHHAFNIHFFRYDSPGFCSHLA